MHEQASTRSGRPTNHDAGEGRRNNSPKAKHWKGKRGSQGFLGLGSYGGGRGDSASDDEGVGDEGDVKGSFVEALVQGGNEIDGSASVALVEEADENVAQPEASSDGTGLPLTGFQLLVMLSVGLALILIGAVLYGSAVGHRSIDNARLWATTRRSIQGWRQTSKRWRFGLRS